MTNDPPLDKYIAVTYIGTTIQTTEHETWGQALQAAEAPYLMMPRRWCHGRRDRGHWTLVQVIGSADVPLEVVNGSWSNGILKPGPLAIIFVPTEVQCCAHHISNAARAQTQKERQRQSERGRKPKPRTSSK